MTWKPGAVVEGFELVGQAPAELSGRAARKVDGAWYRGWWSDPWWGYKPGTGWACVRWWKPDKVHVPSAGDWAGPVPAGPVVTAWPFEADPVDARERVTALCCGHGCD